jgi:hypothetical protein
MNKEKLNEIMNCQCLQSIIENDKNKHTVDEDRMDGCKTIQTPNEHSQIIFKCLTSYRTQVIDNINRIIKDRNEQDCCGIPFLHCPICGTKTNLDIPKESYYTQFEK